MNSQSLNTREKSMEFKPYEPGCSINEHNEIIVKLMPGEFAINAAIYGLLYNYHRFNDIRYFEEEYFDNLKNKLNQKMLDYIREQINQLLDKDNIQYTDDGGVKINLTRYIKLFWIYFILNFILKTNLEERLEDQEQELYKSLLEIGIKGTDIKNGLNKVVENNELLINNIKDKIKNILIEELNSSNQNYKDLQKAKEKLKELFENEEELKELIEKNEEKLKELIEKNEEGLKKSLKDIIKDYIKSRKKNKKGFKENFNQLKKSLINIIKDYKDKRNELKTSLKDPLILLTDKSEYVNRLILEQIIEYLSDEEIIDNFIKFVFDKISKKLFRASFIDKNEDFQNYLSHNLSSNNSYHKYLAKVLSLAFPDSTHINQESRCFLTNIGLNSKWIEDNDQKKKRFLNYALFKFIDPELDGTSSKPYVNWDRLPQDKRFPISDLTYFIIIPHFYIAFKIPFKHNNKDDKNKERYEYRYFINTTYSLKLLYHLNEKFERLSKLSNNTILTLPKTIHIALRLSNLVSLGFEVYKVENNNIQRFYISPLVINLLSNSRLITALKSVKEESLIEIVMDCILNENFNKMKYLIYEKLKDYLKNSSQTNNPHLIRNLIKIYREIVFQIYEYRDLDTGGGKNMKETRPISQGRFYNSLKNQESLKEVLKNSSYQLLEAARTENWERVGYLISRAMIITGEKTYELINLLNMLPPEDELQAEVLKISIYNLLVALNSELVDTSTQGEGQ